MFLLGGLEHCECFISDRQQIKRLTVVINDFHDGVSPEGVHDHAPGTRGPRAARFA